MGKDQGAKRYLTLYATPNETSVSPYSKGWSRTLYKLKSSLLCYSYVASLYKAGSSDDCLFEK